MLHTENSEVLSLLFKGNFGLEKESLRITTEGRMAHSAHPFPGDKHIVRDFCENQTEINTSVFPTAEGALAALEEHTTTILRRLAELPEPEMLWPFSNPPFIANEADIPVAQFYGDEASKTTYREYLSDRYGRYKMTLCGIHVNYSFADELLEADFRCSDYEDFREYKDQFYIVLAERAAAYGWIVTPLTASSPLLDASFVEKGITGKTSFNGMASTRCSELGYWNYFTPLLDYSGVSAYAGSIQRYVDMGLLAAPTELYFPIRLKPAGKNELWKLKEQGVDHIELRMVDLNPMEYSGMNLKDLKFAQLLLVWLAATPRQPFSMKDQVQAAQNFKNAAHYDLKTVKILVPDGDVYSVADAGRKVIGLMREFYSGLPIEKHEIFEILDFEEAKFIDPENRYSWQLRHAYAEDFPAKALRLAEQHQQEALSRV